jgi:hypothetical protein
MQQIIKTFFMKRDKKVLGRWNIDYCATKINRKIDSSNEDHCGTCVLAKLPPDLPSPIPTIVK